MRLCNTYLFVLTVVLLSTSLVLVALGQQRIDLYVTLYLLGYLIVTAVFAQVHRRGRVLLTGVGVVLFSGFLLLAGIKVAETALSRAILP